MSTFCSDAGSLLIFFFWIIFSLFPLHRSTNENTSLSIKPLSVVKMWLLPLKVMRLTYSQIVPSSCDECLKQNTPTNHISFSPQCRIPGPLALWTLYYFIYFLKQGLCLSCIFERVNDLPLYSEVFHPIIILGLKLYPQLNSLQTFSENKMEQMGKMDD